MEEQKLSKTMSQKCVVGMTHGAPWLRIGTEGGFQVRHARKRAALMAGVVLGEPLADLTFNWCFRHNLKQMREDGITNHFFEQRGKHQN